MIASGYRFSADGDELAPTVLDVAVHRTVDAPAFTDPAAARASLEAAFGGDENPFVGEADVDVALTFRDVEPGAEISLVSTLPELTLPPGIFVDNHIIDFRGGGAQVLNVEGQMQQPVVLDGSKWRAAATFVMEGIRHILEGPDHVLFVLCLAIAATSIGMLLWQVTGFTIGHSITLIAGFLGFVPAAPWFTPAIETAIALSIIYAGLMAIWYRPTRFTILVTGAIGLLHGFGFSFVLGEILGPASPHLILSLLSFNIGVEIGQVLIVAVAYAGLLGAAWIGRRFGQFCRTGIAGASIAIACFWVLDRIQLVAQSVQGS